MTDATATASPDTAALPRSRHDHHRPGQRAQHGNTPRSRHHQLIAATRRADSRTDTTATASSDTSALPRSRHDHLLMAATQGADLHD